MRNGRYDFLALYVLYVQRFLRHYLAPPLFTKRRWRSAATKLATMLGAAAVTWAPSGGNAVADVLIKVTFVMVENEVSPRQAEHRSPSTREYRLTNDHTVSIVSTDDNKYTSNGEATFGSTYAAKSVADSNYTGTIGVDNGAIVIENVFPSYKVISRITTNGIDSCSATRKFRLAAGHKFFEIKRFSNHEDMLLSDMHAENVTCSISEIGK
jgi:hypothetical protein